MVPSKFERDRLPATLSKAHLVAVAKRLDVRGRSKMTKAELVEAIDNASQAETARSSAENGIPRPLGARRRLFELIEPVAVVTYMADEPTEAVMAIGLPFMWTPTPPQSRARGQRVPIPGLRADERAVRSCDIDTDPLRAAGLRLQAAQLRSDIGGPDGRPGALIGGGSWSHTQAQIFRRRVEAGKWGWTTAA